MCGLLWCDFALFQKIYFNPVHEKSEVGLRYYVAFNENIQVFALVLVKNGAGARW